MTFYDFLINCAIFVISSRFVCLFPGFWGFFGSALSVSHATTLLVFVAFSCHSRLLKNIAPKSVLVSSKCAILLYQLVCGIFRRDAAGDNIGLSNNFHHRKGKKTEQSSPGGHCSVYYMWKNVSHSVVHIWSIPLWEEPGGKDCVYINLLELIMKLSPLQSNFISVLELKLHFPAVPIVKNKPAFLKKWSKPGLCRVFCTKGQY